MPTTSGDASAARRMPAEWEPHEATWLAWPHRRSDWPGKFSTIPWVYAEIVRHLERLESVRILVNDSMSEARAARGLRRAAANSPRLQFHHMATDRSWIRDYGPIFIQTAGGSVEITDWGFNAWAKYSDWHRDNAVPAQVAHALGLPRLEPAAKGRRLVLEGGSIDVNGAGLLLTTEECLLSPVQARNPGLSRADLEAAFREYLGIQQVIWLGDGIAGDDTHGHVDDLARFVSVGTVACAQEPNAADENHRPLAENWERLQGARTQDGARLELVRVPMPQPVTFAGTRLPASYLNFYIANACVLVPTFNDPNDRLALGTLAELFPGRGVIGIHATDLVWGLGTLHCMTQQQPTAGNSVSTD